MSKEGEKEISTREFKQAPRGEPMLESLAWGHNYGAYFTKTSPGLDRWRRENHDQSSEMNFSTRFRSRSPNSYSIKENPAKFHDFEKGKSLLGSSSSHAGLGTTEKETIIRRTTYINRDPRRNRNLNLPCTFFSSGSCNLGEDCRFSHLVKACAGLEGRSENKILSDKDTTTAWYVDKSLEHGFEMRNIIDKDPEDESKNLEVEAKKPQENCPLERMKIFNDDARAMCVFKYQLVQCVKDLLTPTWKKGQISKEVYKHIARKVTDKVIASIEGPYIPRTKRKIDQYLSLSKPKIAKLVQAYVEKFQSETKV